jgi:putative spermidine/putrescine transport system ATP-binding protein
VAGVRIAQLRKSYGALRVLDIPSLEIADGEFFSLLGPSGCGKTTTLRLVAGIVEADAGRIAIGERDVTAVPPHRRNVGMVFQTFALFPHLTVAENVAFGLDGRGLSRDEVGRRIQESLELVALHGLDGRYPHQLSGGQQQRVAMARAIAYRPDVLLLDEPFSSLDVKLRTALRADMRQLQRALALTTIFVTHDQQEALALSDRLAVMQAGRIEQIGTPEAIYDAPATAFAADFVGGTNLLRVTVADMEGRRAARVEGGGTIDLAGMPDEVPGGDVTLMVKPERVHVAVDMGGRGGLSGELTNVAYFGSGYSYVVRVGGQRIEARQPDAIMIDRRRAVPGDRVAVYLDPTAVRVVPA